MPNRLYHWISEATVATTATTAATYNLPPASLPAGKGVVSLQIRLTGTNMNVGNLTRIRVRAGSVPLWDCNPAHLEAFLQRMTNGTHDLADADTEFTIPFYDPRFPEVDKYVGQFPWFLGAPQLEIGVNATPGAGTIGASALITDLEMHHHHQFLASRLEVAASSTNANAKVHVPPGSAFKGFTINTTGLDRMQIMMNQVLKGIWTGRSLIESQRPFNSDVITNPIGAILEADEIVGPAGGGEILLTTAAGWAGVANELGIWSYHEAPVKG